MANPFECATNAQEFLKQPVKHSEFFQMLQSCARKAEPASALPLNQPPIFCRSEDPYSDSSFLIRSTHEFNISTESSDVECSEMDSMPGLSSDDSSLTSISNELERLTEALYGPDIGREDPRSLKRFISTLDKLLFGLGVKESLEEHSTPSHQAFLDVLAERGHLLPHVLETFRGANVWKVDLSPTLEDEAQLGPPVEHTLAVFKAPNSFMNVTELVLDGITLVPGDISCILSLGFLESLSIMACGVDDASLFMLTRFTATLTHLNISYNERVSDDITAALLCFKNLSGLDTFATGITMTGARRLASAAHPFCHSFLGLPTRCMGYLQSLHEQYLIDIEPPLVSDPGQCSSLSHAILKYNLSVHASRNRAISIVGRKEELANRLMELLKQRQADLKLRRLVYKSR